MAELKLFRNRLLVGSHGPAIDYTQPPDPETGKRPKKRYRVVTGEPLPIVLDVVNLEQKCGSEKFRCLDGKPNIVKPKAKAAKAAEPETDIKIEEPSDTLDSMSPEELVQMASDYGATLTGDEDAEQLRAKIRELA